MLRFDEELLKRRLEQMPGLARVVFAASCAQRMAHLCHRAAESNDGDDVAYDRALDYVWDHILAPDSNEQTAEILADIMARIPDDDAPGWTPLTPYLEDSLSAVAYSLRCLQSGDAQEAAWAARCVYETIDYFVTHRPGSGERDWQPEPVVLADPLIQAELGRQQRDLSELLAASTPLSRTMLEQLRTRSAAEQVLPLL